MRGCAVARSALAMALGQQAVGQHRAGQALDVVGHDVVAAAQQGQAWAARYSASAARVLAPR